MIRVALLIAIASTVLSACVVAPTPSRYYGYGDYRYRNAPPHTYWTNYDNRWQQRRW